MGLKYDQPPEWEPLKGLPYDERLELTSVSGNVSEFVSPRGHRFRCVKDDKGTQWFTLPTNKWMKKATRANVKICCKKFERSFGNFLERPDHGRGVRIFPKRSGLGGRLASEIKFCPWCGKELQFLNSEKTAESRVRSAKAGA